MKGKDRPQNLGQKEYDELGKTVSLMLRMCRPIFVLGESVVLGSEFCVAKGIKWSKAKGVYAGALIKKRHYCLKGVHADLINTCYEYKDVVYV